MIERVLMGARGVEGGVWGRFVPGERGRVVLVVTSWFRALMVGVMEKFSIFTLKSR